MGLADKAKSNLKDKECRASELTTLDGVLRVHAGGPLARTCIDILDAAMQDGLGLWCDK